MLTIAVAAACGNDVTRIPTSAVADQTSVNVNLADTYRQLLAGDAATAATGFEAARANARRRDDGEVLAQATLGLGDALTVTGAWPEARDAYQQLGPAADGALATAARARLSWLDGRKIAGGEREAALTHYADALAAARQLGDRWLEVRVISSRAGLASFSVQPEETLPELQEVFELAGSTAPPDWIAPDRIGQALALRAMGQIHSGLGDLQQAAQALTEARALLVYPSILKSRVLQDVGILHFRRGEMAEALASLQEASRLAAGSAAVQAYCLSLIGAIYGQQGNEALARQAMEQSLATFESVEDVAGQTMALENLARLSTLFDRGELARDYFSRSLPLHERVSTEAEQAAAWTNFGRLELQSGDLDSAEAAFQKAIKLVAERPDGEEMAYARIALGEVRLRRGEAAEALPLLQQGAAVVPDFIDGRVLIARAQRALGRIDEARTTLRAAIQATEEQMAKVAGDVGDQELYRDTRFAAYGELIDLLAEQGEVASAWAWAERGRARALLAAHGSAGGETLQEPAEDPLVAQEEETLTERLNTLNQQLMAEKAAPEPRTGRLAQLEEERGRARLELETLQREKQHHEKLRHEKLQDNVSVPLAIGRLEAIDPTQLGVLNVDHLPVDYLPADTLVLAYVVLEQKTWLFALPTSGSGERRRPVAFEIAAGSETLTSLISNLQRRLATRHPAYDQPAAQLYGLLIAPAESLLDGARRLCFLPDGPLWDIPLAVLAPNTGEALAARWPSYTAPSLGYLAAMGDLRLARQPRRATVAASLLAVGNPTFSATTENTVSELRGFGALGSLPDAEHEVRDIAALYGPQAQLLIGGDATEAQVKAQAGLFRTLHFASHALLDDVNPGFSALVLAPGAAPDGEDGLLEGWEIAKLRLHADLVVLAGCQTHRGRPAVGRGLRGLSWAFARAGSPAILASHWEVDSAATRLLMVELHRQLQDGDDPAAALYQAAALLRKDERYQHPFYWAGFTLVGDPGDLP